MILSSAGIFVAFARLRSVLAALKDGPMPMSMPLPLAPTLDSDLPSATDTGSQSLAGYQPLPSRPTLLIVDDEEGPRLSLTVIFGDEFNILMAEDGPSAIDLARRYPIDVAVLDIRMAGMSGIEVLERLRYLDPNTEAVMMTAF